MAHVLHKGIGADAAALILRQQRHGELGLVLRANTHTSDAGAGPADVAEHGAYHGFRQQVILHRQGTQVVFFQRGALIEFQGEHELALITGGDEFLAHDTLRHHDAGGREQREDDAHENELVAQHPAQRALVPIAQIFHAALETDQHASVEVGRLQLALLAHARCEPWRKGEAHEKAHQCAHHHHHAELFQQVGHEDLHEDDRQEDHHVHQGDGERAEADLRAALDRSGDLVVAFVQIALDVFQDHDRVVHEDADDERHGEQGHQVQRVAEEAHGEECAYERGRDGHQHDERIPQAVQEDQHDEGDQQHGQSEVEKHAVHRFDGDVAAVIGEDETHARGLLLLFDPDEFFPQGAAHFHGIRIPLFLHQQADTFFAVVAVHRADVGDAVHHGRDVLHAHHGARRGHGHHHVLQFLHGVDLAGEFHGDLVAFRAHVARRHLLSGAQDRLGNAGQRQAVMHQFGLVHLHLHLALFTAQQRDLRYTFQLLEARQQLVVHHLVELRRGQIAQRGDAHDRQVVGRHLGHHRWLHAVR